MKVNKRFCQNQDHIIYLQDGNYRQEEIINICTYIDCKNRFVCQQCQMNVHNNHKDALEKITQIQQDIQSNFLENVPGLRDQGIFTYEKEQFKELKNKVIDYVNDLEKQFVQLCKETQALYDAQKVINLSKDGQILLATNDELNNFYEIFYTKAQSSIFLSDQYLLVSKKIIQIVEQLSLVEKQCKINEQGNFIPQIQRYIKQKTILEFYLKNPLDYSQVPADLAQIKGVQFTEKELANDKEIYYGELNSKQQRHGKGIQIQIESQIIYEGIWNQNQIIWGQKTSYNENNECSIFRGRIKDKKLKGDGEKLTSTGYKFIGYFENDLLTGYGKFIKLDSKETYEGNFQDGKKHGRGKHVYDNGNIYEGQFKNGMKQGRGELRYKNGDVYIGDFYDDKFYGQGELRYKNGDVYKGSFQEDKFNGKGEYISDSQKTSYIGHFKNGKKEGDFTLIYGSGEIEQRKFVDDKNQGELKNKKSQLFQSIKQLAKGTTK